MPRRLKIFTALASIVCAADQVTKYWARRLPTDEFGRSQAVSVIDNYFDWQLSFNTGSAFGLFRSLSGARVFLTVVAIVAVIALVWMLIKARDEQTLLAAALGFVAGGAVGNLIDRVLMGKVTDFIVWRWHDWRWPTFNIADAALCVGIGLLFLSEFRRSPSDPDD